MTATCEYIILVDELDKEIGLAEKLSAHQNNQLHRAFSIFIFRPAAGKKELLLQQRALQKYHSPGLWTNTCCGHPRQGESILEAGQRRLAEELGMQVALQNVGGFHYQASFPNGLHENEIDHVLVGHVSPDIVITPNPEEIHAYRWIGLEELHQELADRKEQFTPWLQRAFEISITGT